MTADTLHTPSGSHATVLSLKTAIKPFTTLIALVVLMVLFELTGRIWSSEVKGLVLGALSGENAFSISDIFGALTTSISSPEFVFFSPRNLTNLSLQVSLNGILAIGMTLVILTSGIDLGIGSVVALCGICLGLAESKWGLPLWMSLSFALFVGTSIGGINGFLISKFRIPPFVVTLGFLVIARGLALIFSGSSAISPLSDEVRFLGSGFLSVWVLAAIFAAGAVGIWIFNKQGNTSTRQTQNVVLVQQPLASKIAPVLLALIFGFLIFWSFGMDRGVPVPVLILIVIGALGIFLLSRTTFGRGLYALGGNETAALLSGIPVQRIKFLVYVVMGFLAALAGIVLSGRLNSATPTEGQLMELDAIAAVVIGGTSLQGGVGRIQGSIAGAFIIGVLNNGMDMLELSTDYQMVMKGLIIVFAVWSDSKAKKV